ncbi:MAG TPA: FAD-dependent monooxygenase [Xanthobacteraceae bacterium]|nr:FAD-dependent monooxygenase [Xanthobacteraceae bacterium]
MLYVGQWKQNLLLADSFMQDRVFLAGDAVHLVIPTGGLGMNTGVGEATDLAWKLAAMLQGWAVPTCSPPMRSSAGRSARATLLPRPLRRADGANGAPPILRSCASTRRKERARERNTSASPTRSSANPTR